jgi:plasmid stability protein
MKDMASITIRRLDESTKERLRRRAARHGHSMEEEARQILKTAVSQPLKSGSNLAAKIRKRFSAVGGVELPPVPREPAWEPIDFSGPEYDR